MLRLYSRLLASERGASLAEYGLLATLVAIVALVAVRFLGVEVDDTFDTVGQSIAAATN